MTKKVKLRILTVVVLFCLSPIGVFAGLTNFQMWWVFTNSAGTNDGAWNDICVGGTIYIKNLSKYANGSPIPNTLTGTYKIYDAVGTSPGTYIGEIPAQNWPYNGVYAFTVPVNALFDYSQGLNIRIKYVGSDVDTGNRERMLYLTTRGPAVNAGPDQTICQGEPVTLSGTGATSYIWNPGGSTQSSIQVYPSTSTTYNLTGSVVYNTSPASITQNLTCSKTDGVNITVLPNPTVKGWLRNHYLCTGSQFPFLNAYAGLGSFSYQWSYSQTGFSYSVLSATSSNLYTGSYGFGYYKVVVTNNSTGCSTTLVTRVSLDSSGAWNLNSGFDSFEDQDQLNNTVQISTTPYETGNHTWDVYNSDINQNQGSLINSYPTTTIDITLPLTGYYLIKHTVSKAPCNEPKSTTAWYAYDFSGKVMNKQILVDNTNQNASSRRLNKTQEIDESNSFNIYPNPTNGKFNVECKGSSVQQITVYDAVGKVISENKTEVNSTNVSFDLSLYPSGIYFIKLNTGEKTIMRKIVKE